MELRPTTWGIAMAYQSLTIRHRRHKRRQDIPSTWATALTHYPWASALSPTTPPNPAPVATPCLITG